MEGTSGASLSFAMWLTKARRLRGLPQSDVAEAIGRSQEYVSMLERGERSPSHATATLIGGALAPNGASDEAKRALVSEAVRAAFPDGTVEPASRIESIIQEAGYDPAELDEDDKATLSDGINALVVGTVERQRRQRQKARA